jgi:hypothetical protein
MERKAAKELLHIQVWLERVGAIVERGKDVYLADGLLQEAGDSLMMKLGEAACPSGRPHLQRCFEPPALRSSSSRTTTPPHADPPPTDSSRVHQQSA